MRNQLREDIRLTAYAVSLGYELVHSKGFTEDGSPKDEVRFRIRHDRPEMGTTQDVEVFLTAMGWRLAVEEIPWAQGQMIKTYLRPDPTRDFFTSLKKALDQGVLR